MAGMRDRLILFPRYTTLAGGGNFTTLPINVSAYEGGEVRIWMGSPVHNGTFEAVIQESTDQDSWTTCAGNSSQSLAANVEKLFDPTFSKAWMRLKIASNPAGSPEPVFTVYAVGYVEKRRK